MQKQSTRSVTLNGFRIYLVALVLLSFSLNLWGNWNVSSMDEYNEVIEALRVCSGHLNLDRWGKRVFLYILALEYGLYFGLGWILGFFSSVSDFATKIARDMQPLFIIGRITSALFITGAVWLTYRIGQEIHSRSVGLVAATFFACTPLAIELAHYARVDACLTFLMISSMYYIIRILQDQGWHLKSHILASLFAGLSFQCKTQGILLLVPLAIAYFFRWRRERPLPWPLVGKILTTATVSFGVGIILGNPVILFAFSKYLQSLMGMGRVYTTAINVVPSAHIGFVAYAISFHKQMGLLLLCTIAIAIPYTLFVLRRQEHILLFSLLLMLYLVLGASRYMVSFSYMLPLLPYLYIFVATFIADVSKRIVHTERIRAVAVLTFCVLLAFHPAMSSAELLKSMCGPNTRILAKQWIEANIPAHSKILMDSGKSFNTFAPLIAENAVALQRMLESGKQRIVSGTIGDSRGIMRPDSLILYELLLKTVPEISYDITTTGFGLYVKDLEYYPKNGFQYMIMSKDRSSSYLSKEGRTVQPRIAAFYESAMKELTLLKTIGPTQTNHGDTYYIFSFNQ